MVGHSASFPTSLAAPHPGDGVLVDRLQPTYGAQAYTESNATAYLDTNADEQATLPHTYPYANTHTYAITRSHGYTYCHTYCNAHATAH